MNFLLHETTKFSLIIWYYFYGWKKVKVKVFDEAHEKDLERTINDFLNEDIELIDIKFDVSASIYSEEQIYCFSALILYKDKDSQS